jgi:hypothetical protein
LTETFNWIKTAVSDFLLPAFNVKCLIDWAKEGLGNANSATRTAAVQLLGTLHAFLGPALGDMVSPMQRSCRCTSLAGPLGLSESAAWSRIILGAACPVLVV